MAPAGAQNGLCAACVRFLRGVLRLGGVEKPVWLAVGAEVPCVRFEIRPLSATRCTRYM